MQRGRLVVVFASFVFMLVLVLLCFCVATVFRWFIYFAWFRPAKTIVNLRANNIRKITSKHCQRNAIAKVHLVRLVNTDSVTWLVCSAKFQPCRLKPIRPTSAASPLYCYCPHPPSPFTIITYSLKADTHLWWNTTKGENLNRNAGIGCAVYYTQLNSLDDSITGSLTTQSGICDRQTMWWPS